jgi:hypothetical protein
MSVLTGDTWGYTPEDGILHGHSSGLTPGRHTRSHVTLKTIVDFIWLLWAVQLYSGYDCKQVYYCCLLQTCHNTEEVAEIELWQMVSQPIYLGSFFCLTTVGFVMEGALSNERMDL